MANDSGVELRGYCPREVVDVLDAVSAAKRTDRMKLVNSILRSWAQAKMREVELVNRVTRGTTLPAASEDAE